MIGKIDTAWLKNFVLNTVKPLKSGKLVKNSADTASMDNLYPEGYSDKFKLSQPFGLVSNIPKGVTGFYQNLFGSGHESIILGLVHKLRPTPAQVGSTTLYSTTADGQTIKATVTLNPDGSIEITAPSANFNVTASNATVTATTKAKVVSPAIELGGSTLEKVLNGETFLQEYKTHSHLDSFGLPVQTVEAVRPVVDANQLSQTVKAKK